MSNPNTIFYTAASEKDCCSGKFRTQPKAVITERNTRRTQCNKYTQTCIYLLPDVCTSHNGKYVCLFGVPINTYRCLAYICGTPASAICTVKAAVWESVSQQSPCDNCDVSGVSSLAAFSSSTVCSFVRRLAGWCARSHAHTLMPPHYAMLCGLIVVCVSWRYSHQVKGHLCFLNVQGRG